MRTNGIDIIIRAIHVILFFGCSYPPKRLSRLQRITIDITIQKRMPVCCFIRILALSAAFVASFDTHILYNHLAQPVACTVRTEMPMCLWDFCYPYTMELCSG